MSLIMCIFTRFYLLITNLKKIKIMTREEARDLLPIITAYADGKPLQYFSKNGIWEDCNDPGFYERVKYRIKPETKYRPFKDFTECWFEMLRHEPFAWLHDKETGSYVAITSITDDDIQISSYDGWDLEGLMKFYTFADGEPFGIKQV